MPARGYAAWPETSADSFSRALYSAAAHARRYARFSISVVLPLTSGTNYTLLYLLAEDPMKALKR
jgi:hypothetical protein